MKYEYRINNPICDCGHAYHSHGMPKYGWVLAMSGIFISLFLMTYLANIYEIEDDEIKDNMWVLVVSMIPTSTVILLNKNPFRKQCIICKCPNFIEENNKSFYETRER